MLPHCEANAPLSRLYKLAQHNPAWLQKCGVTCSHHCQTSTLSALLPLQPYLPDQTQPGGDVGQRLWAADALGFAMAPTSLPLSLLHTKPTAAPGAAMREAAPFIANLYIKVRQGVCTDQTGGHTVVCSHRAAEAS